MKNTQKQVQRSRKGIVGAWLKPLLPHLTSEVLAIDHALDRLGLTRRDGALRVPKADSRFDRLLEVVTQHLRDGKQWKDDERLIIFTEYKTTLDYLFLRLKSEFQNGLRVPNSNPLRRQESGWTHES